jgi:hypothetical protein
MSSLINHLATPRLPATLTLTQGSLPGTSSSTSSSTSGFAAAQVSQAPVTTQSPATDNNKLQQPGEHGARANEAPVPATGMSKMSQPLPSQQPPQGATNVVSQLDSLLAAVKGLRADMLARNRQDDAGSSEPATSQGKGNGAASMGDAV